MNWWIFFYHSILFLESLKPYQVNRTFDKPGKINFNSLRPIWRHETIQYNQNFSITILKKVNATITAIVSGANNPNKITTFDWTTMLYHAQPITLNGNRQFCSCGLLRNKESQLLVAAAGEIWGKNIIKHVAS